VKPEELENLITTWLLRDLELDWEIVRGFLPKIRRSAKKPCWDRVAFWYARNGKPQIAFWDTHEPGYEVTKGLAGDCRVFEMPWQTGPIN
jgi:hypothetical protein